MTKVKLQQKKVKLRSNNLGRILTRKNILIKSQFCKNKI